MCSRERTWTADGGGPKPSFANFGCVVEREYDYRGTLLYPQSISCPSSSLGPLPLARVPAAASEVLRACLCRTAHSRKCPQRHPTQAPLNPPMPLPRVWHAHPPLLHVSRESRSPPLLSWLVPRTPRFDTTGTLLRHTRPSREASAPRLGAPPARRSAAPPPKPRRGRRELNPLHATTTTEQLRLLTYPATRSVARRRRTTHECRAAATYDESLLPFGAATRDTRRPSAAFGR